jgi:hypothetical protein
MVNEELPRLAHGFKKVDGPAGSRNLGVSAQFAARWRKIESQIYGTAADFFANLGRIKAASITCDLSRDVELAVVCVKSRNKTDR